MRVPETGPFFFNSFVIFSYINIKRHKELANKMSGSAAPRTEVVADATGNQGQWRR